MRNTVLMLLLSASAALPCTLPSCSEGQEPPCCDDRSTLPEYFYYGDDEKWPLDLSTSKLGVCFEDTLSEVERSAVVAGVPILRPYDERQREFTAHFEGEEHYYVFLTRDCVTGAQVLGAIAQLSATAGVRYAGPVFTTLGDDYGLSDVFSASYPDSISSEEVDAMNNRFAIEVISIRHLEGLNRTSYTLRVTRTSRMNALDMANTYHEDSLTVFGAPSFFGLFDPFDK